MARNTYGGATLPALPFKRIWAKCVHCGQHLFLFDNTAWCSGIYMKCRRCKKESEIKIILGVQEKPPRVSNS